MKVIGVAGWKNSGKTTLVERLVTEIGSRGVTVSTIKHAHHAFDVDQEGTDSYRHRTAGAREVLLSSSRRYALMHELRGADEPGLEELLGRLSPVDLVLVEGFKNEAHVKIEAHRMESFGETGGKGLLAMSDPSVRAVATDNPELVRQRLTASGRELPVFELEAIGVIADFILRETELNP